MSACKWDRDTETYMIDGEPCKRDDYGDPTRHCQARRTCSQHVGPGEITCARCLGRTRTNLHRLVDLAALYLPAAIETGRTDREAISLAGPVAHYPTWEHRTAQRRRNIYAAYPTDDTLMAKYLGMLGEESDEQHPTVLLDKWVTDLAAAYNLAPPKQLTVSSAVNWLNSQLGTFAQDPNQEWGRFAREVRDCMNHVENVLSMRRGTEQGVPCPTCHGEGKSVRLHRLYAHWCDDPDCERIHPTDESGDVWRCPRNRAHEWTPKAYRDYLMERKGA